MDIYELIAAYRIDADDLVGPDYLSSDLVLTGWFNEAENEAAIRASLIHDSTTAAVCSIAVTANTKVYALHPAVLDITRAAFTPTGSATEYDLYLTNRIEQDRNYPGWRTISDIPEQAMQTDSKIELGRLPNTDGTLAIECYRLPLNKIEDQANESPEIGSVHHRHLVQWVLHKCYMRPDAEIHDPGRAAIALAEFTRVFGIRPDADYRRSFQSNRPAHNQAVW